MFNIGVCFFDNWGFFNGFCFGGSGLVEMVVSYFGYEIELNNYFWFRMIELKEFIF